MRNTIREISADIKSGGHAASTHPRCSETFVEQSMKFMNERVIKDIIFHKGRLEKVKNNGMH